MVLDSVQPTAPPDFLRLAGHPLRWRLVTSLAESDLRVRELVARVGEPQNLVSYHLRLLRDGGLVRAGRSSFDGRDSYYHLDLDRCARDLRALGLTLHPALDLAAATPRMSPAPPKRRTSVLFVCTGNSARSPVAEALLRHRAGNRVSVVSAGTRPKDRLHPEAIRALDEAFGIDLAGRRPRALDSVAARRRFDLVVTLCDKAREECPELSDQPRRLHWSIADPAADAGGYAAFQSTVTEIDTRVRHLLPVLAIAPKETQT